MMLPSKTKMVTASFFVNPLTHPFLEICFEGLFSF